MLIIRFMVLNPIARYIQREIETPLAKRINSPQVFYPGNTVKM